MDADMTAVMAYLKAHREAFAHALIDFLKIPSVSAQSAHREDVANAAAWLAERLRDIGLENVAIVHTALHPVVRGDWLHAGAAAPTVLLYGHYDVQPADPVASWESPPFAPEVRAGKLFGRGASDDKGQVVMHLSALEAWFRVAGGLPINLQVLFEGEEEIGSPHLEAVLHDCGTALASDIAVISDTPMFAAEAPSICYGLRGLVDLEVHVEGPRQDLHSGVYGGAVLNPAHALSSLIASLHDGEGRVTVPGFYDGLIPLSDQERARLAQLPFDPAKFLEETGAPALWGPAEYSVWERLWTQPTLEVNGMWSGYIEEGRKTIIPHDAHAKISCRLVPRQDPEYVRQAVVRALTDRAPEGVRLTFEGGASDPGAILPIDHPAVEAARHAIMRIWQRNPVWIRMGGSIPLVSLLERRLHTPTLLLGFALPDEHFHAPNEYFTLANFYRGMETVAELWHQMGERTLAFESLRG